MPNIRFMLRKELLPPNPFRFINNRVAPPMSTVRASSVTNKDKGKSDASTPVHEDLNTPILGSTPTLLVSPMTPHLPLIPRVPSNTPLQDHTYGKGKEMDQSVLENKLNTITEDLEDSFSNLGGSDSPASTMDIQSTPTLPEIDISQKTVVQKVPAYFRGGRK